MKLVSTVTTSDGCFTTETLAVCEQRRAEFAMRRALVLDGLARIGLPVPVPPDGAFYVYFDVSCTGLTSWQFCERALQEAHVALTPGRDFGDCGADRFVRLSYAASYEALEQAIEGLESLMARLHRSASATNDSKAVSVA